LKKAGINLIIICIYTAFFGMAAVSTAAAEDEFEIKPLYVFQNKAARDPFTARNEKHSTTAVVNVDISTFSLLGITQSGGLKTALFKSRSGSPFGYIFTEGRLYGENDRVIPGIDGEIRGVDTVVLRQGDKEVLFRLDAAVDGPNIRPEQKLDGVNK